jgi:lipid-A-disaccharide synthase
MRSFRIMFVAGEASGDTLAAELIQALQAEARRRAIPAPLEFIGAGGPCMAAAGAQLTFDLTAHAVVGIWEVLKNYRKFKVFFKKLLEQAQIQQPDLLVLVDYPGFNLRLARAIKSYVRRRPGSFHNWQPRIAYYVSPQVWAWHASRVRQIAEDVDLMLAIFPFEKDWYAERAPHLPVTYVGHPLIERYAPGPGHENTAALAQPKCPPVLLLPGSRVRELKKHLPVMLAAARLIRDQCEVSFRMVLPNEDLARLAQKHIRPALPVEIQVGGLANALQQAALALASSGTVTLECAFFRVPTVVLYRLAWPTYWLGRIFVNVKFIAMPNLLANECVYPEFIQHAATAGNMARAALDLLENPERRRAVQTTLDRVMASLGQAGASARAARAILDLLCEPPSTAVARVA